MSSAAQLDASRGPKRRGWRIAGIVLGVVVVLLVAAAFALRQAYPPERISAMLAEEVSTATGRPFRIDGDLSIRLFPTIAVRANDVVLGNVDWGSQPDMLKFRQAAFDISLRDLLDHQIRILSAEVEGAEILLEADGAGHFNWQFAPHPRAGSGKPAPVLEMDRFLVSGAHITYRNVRKGVSREMVIDSLDLQVQGERDNLSGVFKLGSQQWKAEGEVGRVVKILAGAEDWPFDVRFTTEGASLSATGTIGTGPRAGSLETRLTLKAGDAKALHELSAAASVLPMPVEASATVRRGTDEWRFEALTLSLAGQVLNGQVVMSGDPKPRVDAELSSASIDLGKWHTAKPAPAANAPRAPLFGDAPLITLDALPEVPLRIALKVDRLNVPGMPAISGLQARAASDQGRLTIEPLSFAAAGGTVQGRVGLTLHKGAAPQAEVQLNARSLSVEDLDAQWGSTNHFKGGRANLDIKLAMTGRTPRSLAGTSNGDVQLSARNIGLTGRSATLDRDIIARLFDALLPKQASRDDLVVQCVAARLPLRNGVATIDRSIVMETPQIAVAASGEINLAKQTLELAFLPRVKKGLDLNPGNLVQLLLLKGPLGSPEFSIDPKGTVREAATVGVAAATGGLSLLAPALFGSVAPKDCGLQGAAGGQNSKSQKPDSGGKLKVPHPFGLLGR